MLVQSTEIDFILHLVPFEKQIWISCTTHESCPN